MQMISRSQGRSATAAAAYRGGYAIEDERTGRSFDYSRRGGVLDDTILAPKRAPEWARNGQDLWNQVELKERRKDAQVARENVVALPHELTLEQNRELLHEFVQDAYVRRGMVAQVSIHGPGREGDQRNIHAHILLTTRQVTRNGLQDKKTRSWNEKSTLQEWREQWAEYQNRALERAGVKERVDHRSYEDQGVDKMATQHLGPEASKMEREGEKTRIGDENRAAKEFNHVIEQQKAELKAVELLIAEEKKRLEHDSKHVPAEEYDRDAELAEQEMRIVDAAIAHEKQRLKDEQREAKELARAEAEAKRHLAALDRERDRSAAEERRRSVFREELNELYRTEQVEADLRFAEERLAASGGFFSRLIGRQARCEREVEEFRQNLENIRQREAEAFGRLERDFAEARKRDGIEAKAPSPTPSQEISKTIDERPPPGAARGENSLSEDFERVAGPTEPPPGSGASVLPPEPISGEKNCEEEKRSALSSEFAESTAGGRDPDQSLVDEILRELGGDEIDFGGDDIGRDVGGPER